MRYGAFLGLLLVVPLAAACRQEPVPFDQTLKAEITAEVEETLAGLTEAMNAHDSKRVFGFFRQSEDFLYLGCTDYLFGFEAFSVRVGPYYDNNPEVTFHQEVVQVQVLSPTVAVAALRGGSTEAEALFWTEVLVKEGGKWVITHEHESWAGCSPPSAAHPFTTPSEMSNLEHSDTGGT